MPGGWICELSDSSGHQRGPSDDCISVDALRDGRSSVCCIKRLVREPFRGLGVGRMLAAQIFHAALIQRIDAVSCFSTDAQEYWAHMGIVRVLVLEVLQRFPQVPHVLQFDDLGWLPTEVAWRYDIQS